MSHIFVSYSKKNKDYALSLVNRLLDEGFDVWIDNRRLKSSEDWWRSIVEALRDSGAFVVILTPDSDASEWVQLEITLAMKYKKARFPLWLAGSMDTPNWALFARTQYIDVTNGQLPPPEFFDDLAGHVRRKPHRGSNVTATGRLDKKVEEDPIFQEALNNPPAENGQEDDEADERGLAPGQAATRSRFLLPIVGIGIAVILLLAAVAILPKSAPADLTPTPPNTLVATQEAVVPTIANDLDALLLQPASIETLNEWRQRKGFSPLVVNDVLNYVANQQKGYLYSLSPTEIAAPDFNVNRDNEQRDAQEMVGAYDYTQQVQMVVQTGIDEFTLGELIQRIQNTSPEGNDSVHEKLREVGFAKQLSPNTQLWYFVMILGRAT